MNKVFGSIKFLKIVIVLSLFIYSALIVSYKIKVGFHFNNNDNYGGAFNSFLNSGYYDSVVHGTSIVYNILLKSINMFIHDSKVTFIVLNSVCQLFLIFFGFYMLIKIKIKKDIYFCIIAGLYIAYSVNLNLFTSASNDGFLAVFIMMLLYFMLFKVNDKIVSHYYFIIIGILLSICLAIRPTAIFLIPILIFWSIVWFKNSAIELKNKRLNLSLLILSFIALTFCLHYPSIKENKSLSFYDKHPENINVNWTQRNYLGLKKIENGKEKLNRDAIWIHTKFDEVELYIAKNGNKSLPRTFLQVLYKDPVLLLKVTGYNIIFSFLRFIRFWGVLFLFMFLPLNRYKIRSLFSNELVTSKLFLIVLTTFSFSCFTFIEMRWFLGYEILIPISILYYLKNCVLEKHIINVFFASSLILVSLFNIKSIISYL